MTNKIKAVIFDMDGVIFDTESIWRDAFILANKKFGISLSEKYRQSICGKTEKVIRTELKKLLPDLDADAYRDYMLCYVNSAIKNGDFLLKPGFDSLVSYLKENSFKIALATSSSKSRAISMFEGKGYNTEEIFDAMVFGDEIGDKSKPDPYIFCKAAQKLSLLPSECVVVEDSINGIRAATDGGFVPIMAVDLIEPDDYCIKNTHKIIRILSELNTLLKNETC